jgi:hypothetical protein
MHRRGPALGGGTCRNSVVVKPHVLPGLTRSLTPREPDAAAARAALRRVSVRSRSGRWECCSAASCPDRTPRSLLLSAALFDDCRRQPTAARFPSTCRRVDARHRQGHHCACYIERIWPNLVSYRPASSIPHGPHPRNRLRKACRCAAQCHRDCDSQQRAKLK